jgi:hypothetical protein
MAARAHRPPDRLACLAAACWPCVCVLSFRTHQTRIDDCVADVTEAVARLVPSAWRPGSRRGRPSSEHPDGASNPVASGPPASCSARALPPSTGERAHRAPATPTLNSTWTLVARRIPGRCTPGLVQGAYVLQYLGHALVPAPPSPPPPLPPLPDPVLLASAGLFDFTVDIGGATSGRMLHKSVRSPWRGRSQARSRQRRTVR